MKKNTIYLCLFAFVMLFTTGCEKKDDNGKSKENEGKVAIFVPQREGSRWTKDQKYLSEAFDSKELKYTLFLAEDGNGAQQIAQIKSAVATGYSYLVVIATNTEVLDGAMKEAYKNKCKVICYDRLIRFSPYVDYYVSVNQKKIGEMQADFIQSKINANANDTIFNELICGPQEDHNSTLFFDGAFAKLWKKYQGAKDETIKYRCLRESKRYNPAVKDSVWTPMMYSGKYLAKDFSTKSWSESDGYNYMASIAGYYKRHKKTLSGVLSPTDQIAFGVIRAIQDSLPNIAKWPVITGMDCVPRAIQLLKQDKLGMTIFKQIPAMAQATADLVEKLSKSEAPETNGTINNGSVTIPTYFLDPVLIDKNNYKEILVDSGYYTEEELQ